MSLFTSLSINSYSSHTSTNNDNICQSHVAVAVIQSIPIFDETKLFSIPLPKAVGTSISFSYFLHIYLVLMFLGQCLHKTFLEQMLHFDVSTFFCLICFWSLPFRTFYQLPSSVQAEEEAFLYQEKEGKLRFSNTPSTPLLPANFFFWNDPHKPYTSQIISNFCSYFAFPQYVYSHK